MRWSAMRPSRKPPWSAARTRSRDRASTPTSRCGRASNRRDELLKELVKHVRNEIGPIATPDVIQWAPGLPKTRSGKIMRRILRKIAENEPDKVGDTSTLADPSVVDDLIRNRPHQ